MAGRCPFKYLKPSLPDQIISNVKPLWISFVSELEIPYMVGGTNVSDSTLLVGRGLDVVTRIPVAYRSNPQPTPTVSTL